MPPVFDIQALCGQFDRREISLAEFVEGCTRMMAIAVGCSRAGIWLFEDSPEGRRLRCLGIFDRTKQRMTLAPDETNWQVGGYFDALDRTGYVMASDVATHPATAGFFSECLDVNGVKSLLASSFAMNGRLFGTFTCTQLNEPANWTSLQLATLKRIGARASLALAGASRTGPFTLPMPL